GTPAATTVAATTQRATPSPTAGAYTVEVDVYSGRRNPELALTETVGDQLYTELGGRAGELAAAAEPTPKLGFRGFVVRPVARSLPVVRITEDVVYIPRDGKRLADPDHRYYRLILADIGPRLPGELRDALPLS